MTSDIGGNPVQPIGPSAMTLTTEEKLLIEQRVANDGKSTLVAYVLWFCVGFLGAHRFYLERSNSGLVLAVLSVVGVAALLAGSGYHLLLASLVWVFVDALLIPGMASDSRDGLRRSLVQEAETSD